MEKNKSIYFFCAHCLFIQSNPSNHSITSFVILGARYVCVCMNNSLVFFPFHLKNTHSWQQQKCFQHVHTLENLVHMPSKFSGGFFSIFLFFALFFFCYLDFFFFKNKIIFVIVNWSLLYSSRTIFFPHVVFGRRVKKKQHAIWFMCVCFKNFLFLSQHICWLSFIFRSYTANLIYLAIFHTALMRLTILLTKCVMQ